jgi:beta-glucosidase
VSYPFGFGLSYTNYQYSQIKAPATASTATPRIAVSCVVKNNGSIAGEEVVQLYVSPKGNLPLKPIQLKGFTRVSLKAGEAKTVTFEVSPEQFAHYKNAKWTIEPGAYELKIGASSGDIRLSQTVKLTGKAISMERKSVFFSENK